MSKWRPSKKCLYVIPDIHGELFGLQLILNRILPLRKQDEIVFLGDYIDRGKNTPKVLDLLINLKKEYNEQVTMLMGNHELMLIDAMFPSNSSNKYLFWMKNGGDSTLTSYLDLAENHLDNPYILDRNRVKDFIPESHKNFIKSRPAFYETDDFIFVHGGCNPFEKIEDQDQKSLIWDRTLFRSILSIKEGKPPGIPGKEPEFTWEKCIVTGHNCYNKDPLIFSKFMMLDCSCFGRLNIMELNSMQGFYAEKGNKKLLKLEF